MKNTLHFLLIIIVLEAFISSCTTEKRLYMSGYNIEWKKSNNSHDKINVAENINSTTNKQIIVHNNLFPINTLESLPEENLTASIVNSDILTRNKSNPSKSYITSILNPIQQKSKINQVLLNTDSCDNIILKSGNEISAKVLEIGESEIKYKKCDNLNGPTIILKKSDIFIIKYSNGTKDIFSSENSPSNINESNGDKKTEGLGIAGFIISLAGFLVALAASMLVGIVIAIVGIIFGIISLTKIGDNPDKYKGSGYSIANIIIGLVTIGLSLLVIALLL